MLPHAGKLHLSLVLFESTLILMLGMSCRVDSRKSELQGTTEKVHTNISFTQTEVGIYSMIYTLKCMLTLQSHVGELLQCLCAASALSLFRSGN